MKQAGELRWRPDRIGTVYGVILNDEDTLERYGSRLRAEPYKVPPVAPVLYIKPANTICPSGSDVALPAGADMVEICGTLGIVFGDTACRIGVQDALKPVAGYIAAMDLTLPHDSLYRPPIREKCFDGALPLGERIVPQAEVADPDRLVVETAINGMVMQRWPLERLVRKIPQLIADVSAFMTLSAGDILLVGVVAGAPRARLGDLAATIINGIGRIEIRIGGAIP